MLPARIMLILTGVFVTSGAWAADNITGDANAARMHQYQPALQGGELVQLTLGLLAVLVAIFALAWFMKRFGRVQGNLHGKLRVLAGLSVGTRERIALVQVGEQQILVGITPGSIRTLHVLDHPIEQENLAASVPGFSDKLASFMKKPQLPG
jgi:flagellar protein FliO/FliZ